ncbi:MAG: metal ABC transporter permease [Duncaniella sp.]|nr:metal ABC transporter permease [Duncaniella sp.]
MLEYEFFRNALAGVVMLSIASAIIGTYIVSRRLVSISGGITHACFGGLGLGYWLGVSPVAMAALFAVASSLGVDHLARRHNVREDSAIAVVWALGMALGTLFIFLTPGYVPELNSFLFGNVLTISRLDLLLFAIYLVVLASGFLLFRNTIMLCAFDPDFCRVRRVRATLVSTAMTVMIALCIVLTIKMVGVMLLMSLFSLPQMTAECFSRRFSGIMWLSVLISLGCSVGGLFLSTVITVPCSALIVIIMAILFFAARLIKLCA